MLARVTSSVRTASYMPHGECELTVAPTVWDSRTVHWNASPVGNQTRFVTYVCYCPKSMASEETLKDKKTVFDGRKGTTHWPVSRYDSNDKEIWLNVYRRT